jgi:hypothetical protein
MDSTPSFDDLSACQEITQASPLVTSQDHCNVKSDEQHEEAGKNAINCRNYRKQQKANIVTVSKECLNVRRRSPSAPVYNPHLTHSLGNTKSSVVEVTQHDQAEEDQAQKAK